MIPLEATWVSRIGFLLLLLSLCLSLELTQANGARKKEEWKRAAANERWPEIGWRHADRGRPLIGSGGDLGTLVQSGNGAANLCYLPLLCPSLESHWKFFFYVKIHAGCSEITHRSLECSSNSWNNELRSLKSKLGRGPSWSVVSLFKQKHQHYFKCVHKSPFMHIQKFKLPVSKLTKLLKFPALLDQQI